MKQNGAANREKITRKSVIIISQLQSIVSFNIQLFSFVLLFSVYFYIVPVDYAPSYVNADEIIG